MEESESAPLLSRKELRKQKLMEYLAAKGKPKPPNVLQSLPRDSHNQMSAKTSLKVAMGKENKAPPDSMRWHDSKDKTLVPQRSQDPPKRRALGVSDKVNVTNGKQTAICSSSSSVSAQTKVYQNPLLRKTYTVLSSKSSFTPAATQKNQPHTGSRNLSKVQLNGCCTHAAKSEPKSSITSSRATLCPLEMVSSRISTGPLVKTKTGLVPAVIQPRNPKSNTSHPPGSKRQTFTSSTAKNPKGKGQSSRMSSASASQRPALVIPTNSRAGSKAEAQNKPKPKPLPVTQTQPTGRSQLWTGLRSAGPSKCKTVKPEQSVLTSKRAGQSAHTSKTQVKKNTQSVKADAPASSRPSVKRSSTAVKTDERVWSKDGRETKTNRETQNVQKTSRNIPSVHVATKCTAAARGYRTAPQPSRSISLLGRAAATKTPKVTVKTAPQTEVKKLTAAQEERMRKLQEWRESKGISYKRPPMPVKAPATRTVSVPQPFWASMELEDEAHSVVCAVDRSLEDCIKLLAEGCPADRVEDVLSRLPAVTQKFAKYWICRARLMEQEGNLDVLPMFEEAVRVVLEPVDELRTVVFDILKKKDEIQENEKRDDGSPTTEASPDRGNDPLMTPKPVRVLITGERGGSSVVKYKITATPGGPASQQKEPVRVKGQEVRFFTPVRRSVRIERSCFRYPPSLQDHDVCVNSYSDLISEEGRETSEEESSCSGSNTPMYIYRQNEALEDKVSVKLVLNDSF
ncbi:PREDICTED: cytoskeleton-associated protein 2-like [Poecilia mexicana]|uniref:Cytoskeleton-associated protein 2 C-terminal domain-containing protein n=2 Tax=Poecilia mexicana TaxID=48701 RepID=A0A3B3XWD9_9TELE|nr:PREDICTED: cytoskeleton-associated protein 2-like [Poecilia mexicana]